MAKYTEVQINSELEDKHVGMSYHFCSEKHNIPTTMLYRHDKFKEYNPGKNMMKQSGQTVLSNNIENIIVNSLIICSSWSYSLTTFDLRLRYIVKSSLDKKEQNVIKFKNNMPGVEFALSFLRRHKDTFSWRLCQNIKRARTEISRENINLYFDKLEKSLNNISPCNIII